MDSNIEEMLKWIEIVTDKDAARSKWKDLRNAYLTGNVASVINLMKSGGMKTPEENEKAILFDALDLMDIEAPKYNVSIEGRDSE